MEKIRRIRQAAQEIDNKDMLISVDGGVGLNTIADCAAAGANLFVVGTALLAAPDIQVRFDELTTLARTR